MNAIRTHYLPVTNTKPSRIVATAGRPPVKRIVMACDNPEVESDPHRFAAKILADKMGWNHPQQHGQLIGGTLPDGSMAWVFERSLERV